MLNVKVLNQWLTIKPVYIFITLLVLTIFPKTYSIEFSPYGDGHLYQNYYTEKMANGPDRISNSHYDGVFWNLGPTGIRALLTDRNNEIKINAEGIQFQVRYVFANSPAHNLVQVDDIIIGVNGKKFSTPYRFGYWQHRGFDGPFLDFGNAIEESEANRNGVLSIILLRGGNERTVNVQLDSKGAFTSTFPYNCEKSKQLHTEALAYLNNSQKANGLWDGSAHCQFLACMALLAQGSSGHAKVRRYLNNHYHLNEFTWNWHSSFYAIIMAEYTLATGDQRYMARMREIENLLRANQTRFGNFTFGHAGLPEGVGGYGPMTGTTALVNFTRVLMQKAGVSVDENGLNKGISELDMYITRHDANLGRVYGYGWPNYNANQDGQSEPPVTLDPTLIELKLGDLHQDISSLGTARDPSLGLGLMSMSHTLRPWQNYSPKLVKHHANLLAKTRDAIHTGHGSAMIHAWSAWMGLLMQDHLGYGEPLRKTLDYNIAYINMARVHDGSFYVQPHRELYGFDSNRFSSRTLATSLFLTVLSAPNMQLSLFKDSLRFPEPTTNPKQGIAWSRYHGNWNQLPDFSQLAANAKGVTNQFRLNLGETENSFAYQYKGFINIPRDGIYTFYTSSDDGSRLKIGTREVVDNDGIHGTEEKQGSIGLRTGMHSISVDYFEANNGEALSVSWQGPNINKQVIPASVLYYQGNFPPIITSGPSAHPSSTITLDQAVLLSYEAEDPDKDDQLTHEWTKVSGPGDLITHTGLFTSYTFTKAGTYRLRLTVSDGEDEDSAEISITVYDPQGDYPGLWYGELSGNPNLSDVNPKSLLIEDISSKTEDSINENTTEVFTGSIYDADGHISFTEHIDDFTKIYIDGELILSDDNWRDRKSTSNLNLSPGWHNIEIRISNGGGGSGPVSSPGIGYDPNGGNNWRVLRDPGDASLLRTKGEITPPPEEPNQVPRIVLAASANPSIIEIGQDINLSVEAQDPDQDTLSYTWSKISGPGSINFSSMSSQTIATISTVGNYSIQVSVSDGEDQVTSQVSVTVNDIPEEINLTSELGILDLMANGGINPASNEVWKLGDTYRLVFLSSQRSTAESNQLNSYDTFLQGLASEAGLGGTWKVLGSSASTDARDHTETNPSIHGNTTPIFLVDGKTIVAYSYSDFWDGSLHSGINLSEESLVINGVSVHTGTRHGGTKDNRPLGGSGENPPKITIGRSGDTGSRWLVVYNSAATTPLNLYAISKTLSIIEDAGSENKAPVAQSKSVNLDQGQSIQVQLQADDNDGDPLSYTIVTGPTHGRLSGSAPNLSYTPHSDYFGIDQFTFKANDGKTDSNLATISINITQVIVDTNQTPVAHSQTLSLNQGQAILMQLQASDADGDPLSYSIVESPAQGSLSGSAPNFTYTPNSGYSGNDHMTFRVNDGKENSNTAKISLNIIPAPQSKDTRITGTDGANDSWNVIYNWSNGIPSGDLNAIIATGTTAKVDNPATPTYTGTLTLENDSVLRLESSSNGANNAFKETSSIILNHNATLVINQNTNITLPPINLNGQALIDAPFRYSDWQSTTFNAIQGAHSLMLKAFNGHAFHFNKQNTFSELISLAHDRHRIYAKADGALGLGDVTITGRSDGRSAQLHLEANDCIADSATLTLNGKGFDNNTEDRLTIQAGVNEVVGRLILDGTIMPAGTYSNSEVWLSGEGQLTVSGQISIAAAQAPILHKQVSENDGSKVLEELVSQYSGTNLTDQLVAFSLTVEDNQTKTYSTGKLEHGTYVITSDIQSNEQILESQDPSFNIQGTNLGGTIVISTLPLSSDSNVPESAVGKLMSFDSAIPGGTFSIPHEQVGTDENYKLYRQGEDGVFVDTEKIVSIEDGFVRFSLDSFSVYVLVKDEATNPFTSSAKLSESSSSGGGGGCLLKRR